MAYLGSVTCDPAIVHKLRRKHNITVEDVREALQYPATPRVAWEHHMDHGHRLVAMGTTGSGREVIAWLLPVPSWDEQADTWVVKSARWV